MKFFDELSFYLMLVTAIGTGHPTILIHIRHNL